MRKEVESIVPNGDKVKVFVRYFEEDRTIRREVKLKNANKYKDDKGRLNIKRIIEDELNEVVE